MKKLIILALVGTFFITNSESALAQYFPYNWAQNIGNSGPGILTLNGSCVTSQHHYVTVGKLLGTVDADLSSNFYLVSGGTSYAYTGYVGFIAEYDSSANLIKAFAIGGLALRVSFESVAVDADGNYIIAGTFRDSANFDRNNPSSYIHATGSSLIHGDGFLAKYDSGMNLLWVKTFASTYSLWLKSIEIDSQNNIVLAGTFSNTIDIDPSAAVYNLSTYNTGSGYDDIFLAKYNDSGALIWGKNLGSTNTDKLGDITMDANENIYVGVSFGDMNVFVDSSQIVNVYSNNSMAIVKYSNSGQLINFKGISCSGSGSYIEVNDIEANAIGEVYFTGKFSGSTYFQDPSYLASGTSGGCDYIAKLNTGGDCEWAYHSYYVISEGFSLDIDNQSNIYLSGVFTNTKDFDYKTGIVNLTSTPSTSNNHYIASYDATGSYRWAYRIATNGNSLIKVGNSGKVWMQGSFDSTADFDPGATINNITIGLASNFLSVYTSNGTYQNAFPYNGSGTNVERVTAVDASLAGNVITAGMFSGSIDFDPSLNNEIHTSSLDSNAYIASYSSTGALNWVNQINGRALVKAVKRDAAGNIYVTGYFSGATYFDSNAPASYINSVSASVDIFIGKYNANGVLQWIHSFGNINTDEGHDLSIDQNGNVVATGIFNTAIDFDPSASGTFQLATPVFVTSTFVAKYDSNGNFIHALKIVVADVTAICTDNNNNIFVTGNMSGFGNFNVAGGNAIVYTTNGGSDYDYYIAKYDSSGNYLWAFHIGDHTNNKHSSDIAVDNAGNVYFKGYFYFLGDSVDIDPGANTYFLPSSNGMVIKYDNSGSLLWGIVSGFNTLGDIAVDANGNPTLVANYTNNAELDPGPGTVTYPSTGSTMVAVRYSSVGQYLGSQVHALETPNAVLSPVCMDISDNNEVYIGGFFTGSIDFNLTPGYQDLFINTVLGINGFLLSLNQPNYLAQIPPSASFSANSTNFCEGVCINFQDNSLYAPNNWNWSFPGANPASSTSQNPQNICYATAGIYQVQLIISNPLGADTLMMNNYIVVDPIPQTNAGNDIAVCEGSSLQLNGSGANDYSWSPAATLVNATTSNPVASPINTTTYTLTGTNGSCAATDEITITVNANPAVPTITLVGGELQSSAAFSYQWFFNGVTINGATLQNLFPTQLGNYTVTVFDSTGCFAGSNSYLVTVVGIKNGLNKSSNYVIATNPVLDGGLYIYSSSKQAMLDLRLYDIAGKLIASIKMPFNEGMNPVNFHTENLGAGIYTIEINNNNEIQSLKMLKLNDW